MNVVLLNGSPRQGNTVAALAAIKAGIAENLPQAEVRQIDAAKVQVSGCIACETCGSDGHCVFDDDTNEVIDAIVAADHLVLATPVYWWGITAQLKAIIDKLYSQGNKLHDLQKKVALVVIGEATQDDPQYQLITKQIDCICDYLGWEMVFAGTYTAAAPDDLQSSAEAMAELAAVWKQF